jgi:hypothetical protein
MLALGALTLGIALAGAPSVIWADTRHTLTYGHSLSETGERLAGILFGVGLCLVLLGVTLAVHSAP